MKARFIQFVQDLAVIVIGVTLAQAVSHIIWPGVN